MLSTVSLHIIVACLELARMSEGLSLVPYRDVGHWDVGYGHVLAASEPVARITPYRAEQYLIKDVLKAQHEVEHLTYGIVLKENEKAALCDFVFNLGSGALQKSHLLQRLRKHDRLGAAAEFMKWDHIGKKKISHGLFRRRQAERALFLYGTLPEH